MNSAYYPLLEHSTWRLQIRWIYWRLQCCRLLGCVIPLWSLGRQDKRQVLE